MDFTLGIIPIATLSDMVLRLVAALAAGGVIGLERSYQGRAAGFRTFSLVCLGSALVMVVSLFPQHWGGNVMDTDFFRVDPSRVIQGVLAGVGFLGAGVIFRDGFTVRGLTTAACIWVVASIGVLVGVGMFTLGAIATFMTFTVLSLYVKIEALMPAMAFKQLSVGYPRNNAPLQDSLVEMLKFHGFTALDVSYRITTTSDGSCFEYRANLRTSNQVNLERLARAFQADPNVMYFDLAPSRD